MPTNYGSSLRGWRAARRMSQLDLDEVLGYPDVGAVRSRTGEPRAADLLVPFHYRIGDAELKLFSTIATIGEAHDITLEELRLETFFAADARTEELLRSGLI
ncbi:MAG: hypothetical protein GY953_40975 [bacterium]|nr:hypothetical protein [bacterium]